MSLTVGRMRIFCGDWQAEIDTCRGANCISLKNLRYGVSLLREPPANEEPDNPYLYGMPILFPVNRIEGGVFFFEGRRYAFPVNEPATGCHLHGELHKTPFDVISCDEGFISCRYRADDREYLGFPHSFEVLQEYELREDGLYHSVTVTNLSESNMPVFLGFHTTFNTLLAKDSKAENMRVLVDISEEYERNMEINYLPTGRRLPFDAVSCSLSRGTYKPFDERMSRHYRGNGRMSITDIGNGLSAVYEADEKFGFRLIYNGGSEGYICLEPQTCLANCQNSPFPREEVGFDFLGVGEGKTYRSKIFVEEI